MKVTEVFINTPNPTVIIAGKAGVTEIKANVATHTVEVYYDNKIQYYNGFPFFLIMR